MVAHETTPPRLFRRLFIANRGEVAVRIARACDRLGVTPVFAVSDADRNAAYVSDREIVRIGPSRAAHSYLDMETVIQAARQSQCTAVHPGWGFLAENPTFASLCETHGLTFVGPPAHVMYRMGKKTPAKQAMRAAGLTCIPGSPGVLASIDEARSVAAETGYPVLIKAESGGGGRGMRIARGDAELADAVSEARAEAQAAFGDSRVYLERLIEGGRHIEVQVMADRYGNVVHVGERDCTVQRNHQKLIEESPCPVLSDVQRALLLDGAVRAVASIGYVGAGTLEFLLDTAGTVRFMEMNTRLQVEHCVSEQRAGIDLVAEQIRIAAGHGLQWSQHDIALRGHAIECRINAEDPERGFAPCPGTITRWEAPQGDGIRVDTHVQTGYTVPPHYDSLLCKVITHASTRDDAAEAMIQALSRLVCEGVTTTVAMHQRVLASKRFRSGKYDTRDIPGWPPQSQVDTATGGK